MYSLVAGYVASFVLASELPIGFRIPAVEPRGGDFPFRTGRQAAHNPANFLPLVRAKMAGPTAHEPGASRRECQ
jgi:hypothetical protein